VRSSQKYVRGVLAKRGAEVACKYEWESDRK
jgi:hypothetical protein